VVACPIAFDSQKIPVWVSRVNHGKIKEESGTAHLCAYGESLRDQLPLHLFFEI